MKHTLLLFWLVLLSVALLAQNTLSQSEFFSLVKAYHPVARQAALQVEMAKAGITEARGAFDPLLQSSNGRKEFGGLLYYDHQLHEVKIPAWFGVDVQAGLETLNGNRTNPEETKGQSGYIGFSVPVARNLLMDKRRAALQQAKIFQQSSLEEQRLMLNDLLLDAAKAYWNWWQQHQMYQLFGQALQNAEQRLRMVKTAYELGDRPAIDTLEALTQLQSFRIRQSEIALELANARLELSVFLWQQEGSPYELPDNTVPAGAGGAVLPAADVASLVQSVGNHPLLRQYSLKLDALQVERRLKFQNLLPSVTLKYNQLIKNHNLGTAFKQPWLENNYRYGVSIALPLRLSEGRGAYRQAKLKIEQIRWEQLNKRQQLETKLRQYANEWQQLQQQVHLQQTAVAQYGALQRGEEQKFFNGESSLFLINSREIKTLEARQKLIELQAKLQKAENSIRWAAGALYNEQG